MLLLPLWRRKATNNWRKSATSRGWDFGGIRTPLQRKWWNGDTYEKQVLRFAPGRRETSDTLCPSPWSLSLSPMPGSVRVTLGYVHGKHPGRLPGGLSCFPPMVRSFLRLYRPKESTEQRDRHWGMIHFLAYFLAFFLLYLPQRGREKGIASKSLAAIKHPCPCARVLGGHNTNRRVVCPIGAKVKTADAVCWGAGWRRRS